MKSSTICTPYVSFRPKVYGVPGKWFSDLKFMLVWSYRVSRKKLNTIFSYNSDCLAVIIRLLFNPTMLCNCDIEEKCLSLLCIAKWLRRETIEWKFLHLFVRDTKWLRSQTLLGCLAQPSTRSRSAWAMANVLTDVQAVIERLLWIETAYGMPFEGLLRLRKTVLEERLLFAKYYFRKVTFCSKLGERHESNDKLNFHYWPPDLLYIN